MLVLGLQVGFLSKVRVAIFLKTADKYSTFIFIADPTEVPSLIKRYRLIKEGTSTASSWYFNTLKLYLAVALSPLISCPLHNPPELTYEN